MPTARALLLAALACLATLAASCGDDNSTAARRPASRWSPRRPRPPTWRGPSAADRAHVVGLLPANADPHDYEVRPGDVKALADADLVVRSGGDLDDWLESAIDSSGTDARELTLIDHVRTREGEGGGRPALVAGPAQRRVWPSPRSSGR